MSALNVYLNTMMIHERSNTNDLNSKSFQCQRINLTLIKDTEKGITVIFVGQLVGHHNYKMIKVLLMIVLHNHITKSPRTIMIKGLI